MHVWLGSGFGFAALLSTSSVSSHAAQCELQEVHEEGHAAQCELQEVHEESQEASPAATTWATHIFSLCARREASKSTSVEDGVRGLAKEC